MTSPRLLTPSLTLLVMTVASCQAPQGPTVASPVQEQMFAHFALARDLRTFAVNGDLERIRVTAAELAESEPTWGLPPGSEIHRTRLHDAARRAAEARDHAQAAGAIAELAAACGTCHLANDGSLGERFQVAAPLMDDPATRHINYLSWVSRLLWDGVVGPSDGMWRTGAAALAGGDGVPTPRGRHVPEAELGRASGLLTELGAQATTALDTEERVAVLARIWTECADCHVNAGVR